MFSIKKMEQFVVSARKYRPQTFKDVVGQQAITNTLLNAIESNHLASALLFTGPRGVGKTTCARILARKINQPGYDDPNEDFAFNVFELDAASNNSVDDIRNLIDQVRIPPQTGQYKVYIIDEVHMLSSAAFNAFLKTLEEPPQGSHILLTTTIRDAVLTTILSRCIAVPLQASRHSIQDKHTTALNEAFEQALLQKGGSDTGAALRFTRFFQSRMSEIREEATGGLETQLKEQLKQYRDSLDKNWKDTREDQIKAQGESIVLRERERLLASLGEILAGALRHKIRPQADALPNIQLIAAANEAKTLLKRLDALEQTRRTLSAGVQEALALESGFLQMIAHP